ncbi:MAG TPA: hypothetical protein VMX17_09360 [Candidatus Glassbacteria bacterium]|nr:hypothetical protein [Candidatus Glassbacteria bacterium]
MKQDIIKRLAFIKYLYEMGEKHSYQSEPINSLSILSFHDAVEFFFQLCCMKLKISQKDIKFMEYFDFIDKKLEGLNKSALSQKGSIRNLNDTRGLMKHRGVRPSKSDIENFRVTTSIFFNENCKIVFEIDFSKISLIDLIEYKQTKEYLEKALKCFQEDKIQDCLKGLAISFEYLMLDFELDIRNKQKSLSRPLLLDDLFIGSMLMWYHPHMPDSPTKTLAIELEKVINNVKKILKFIVLGIDYKKCVKFKIITPSTALMDDGSYKFFLNQNSLTKDEFDFCFNFIIESTLKLQEFSAEIH